MINVKIPTLSVAQYCDRFQINVEIPTIIVAQYRDRCQINVKIPTIIVAEYCDTFQNLISWLNGVFFTRKWNHGIYNE